LLNMN